MLGSAVIVDGETQPYPLEPPLALSRGQVVSNNEAEARFGARLIDGRGQLLVAVGVEQQARCFSHDLYYLDLARP